ELGRLVNEISIGSARIVAGYSVKMWDFLVPLAGRFFPGGRHEGPSIELNGLHPFVVIQMPPGHPPIVMYSMKWFQEELRKAAEDHRAQLEIKGAPNIRNTGTYAAAARFKLHANAI